MLSKEKPHRILLVDNQVLFRKGLSALLSQFSDMIVIGEEADCSAARRRARDLAPDVILLSSQAFEGSIAEVITGFRYELPMVRVIILTSIHSEPRIIWEAIRAGASGFIPLDREIDELIKAIRMAIEGQAILTLDALTSLIDHLSPPRGEVASTQPVDSLTTREHEVLKLVSKGITNREIAERLYVSESTVRSHVHNILSKLHLTNRVQAAAFALADQMPIQPRLSGPRMLPAGTVRAS